MKRKTTIQYFRFQVQSLAATNSNDRSFRITMT